MSCIKIISATYGPADGLLTVTRDVTPFVRALLIARQRREQEDKLSSEPDEDYDDEDRNLARMAPSGIFIPLMDGKSMNAIFGDPCPGTSKRLHVHYVVYSEVHRVTFAEHERVVLRRRVTFYQDESKLKNAVVAAARRTGSGGSGRAPNDRAQQDGSMEDEDASVLRTAMSMGRTQSIAEFAEAAGQLSEMKLQATRLPQHESQVTENGIPKEKSAKGTRLRSATSEIILPIIMPFLDLRERVHCQLVCKVWRFVIRGIGVAQSVDVNDSSFQNFNRAFLRGILSHSYSSLHSLYLNDFKELTKDDLHPAISHLRKLRSLDISHCVQLDNSTLELLSQHLKGSLEVLYMKGLRKVTDQGFVSMCQSCTKLQVLEISYVKITDESGIAIGENLTQLRALYMRDNYLLTNRSIDVITEKCSRLSQLTLWGCVRLKDLSFESMNLVNGCGNLVVLNVWGCPSLRDAAADGLVSMRNLRSLIVSECIRLSDAFLVSLAQNVPKLAHLHLRYCKRITDLGVNTITNSMQNMYSLDLSFCTKLTIDSICNLLETRSATLSELRLQSCCQLRIAQSQSGTNTGDGSSGRSILAALQTNGDHYLCTLDVRNCGGQLSAQGQYSHDDPFVQGMSSLQFEQVKPGFFTRSSKWNANVQRRLLDELVSSDTTSS